MTTPEKATEVEETEPEKPVLSLVKPEPIAPPVETDPEDNEPEEDEEAYDGEEEKEPNAIVVHVRAIVGADVWKSIWEVLDLQGFLTDLISDVSTGSKRIVTVCVEWVFKPEGDDAWKPILARSAVFVVPAVLLLRAIFVHQRKDLFPLVLFCWVLAAWIVGASGMGDKKRKKARKKAKKKAKKKKEQQRQKKVKKVDEEPEEFEEGEAAADEPREPTWEERRAGVCSWIEEKIKENPKGKNGIHMDDLYDVALKEKKTTPETDQTTFRKVIEEHWRITVTGVKVGGANGKNRTGVKLSDVQRAE